MDAKLKEAACLGDVEFLKRAVETKPNDYFLAQFTPSDPNDYIAGNIFHLATRKHQVKFIKEAQKLLTTELQHILFTQTNKHGLNPLHMAAWLVSDNLEIVKLILEFYKSNRRDDDNKPWLALPSSKRAPLHFAITRPNEESAMEIMSMDMELLCGMLDNKGNSPLFLAVQNGLNRVAEKILMSSCNYSISGQDGSTPLHFAPKCSENVLRLLLEKHPDLINAVDDKEFNVVHQWAEMAEVWPLKFLLQEKFGTTRTKVFKDLICCKSNKKMGDNPLHIAARIKNNIDVVQTLVHGYQQEIRGNETLSLDCPPWKTQNKYLNTPLHLALYSNLEDLALYFLSLDSTLCHFYNDKGESPLFLAVAKGCAQVVEQILTTQEPHYSMLRRNDGFTVLHFLRVCPEKTSRLLLEKFWWLINLRSDNGKTPLDKAKEPTNIPWLIHLLKNPSLIQKEPFNWKSACERNETFAILAFVDTCQDLHEVCRKQNDTPLHHIKLQTYKDYLNFLKTPSIMEIKNMTDYEGATPLHRALERKDMRLAKALLNDNGVERNIQDYHGTTSMDLLLNLCEENADWMRMCKQMKINPYLKTSYIQPGTNLDQMRNTLSVVAALLATITFAAGFTLPGGLNSETGYAMLAKKGSFLVFLLADAYAMCTSMLVLFCLIWSMVSNRDMSYLLVDRSVVILMQSLYGTMVAFMTGIYAVTEHSSLWAAIIIFVMCSFIGISANRTVLHNILAKLIPAANQDQKDQMRLLEEGKEFSSRNGDSQKAEGACSNPKSDQKDQIPLLEEGKASTSGNDEDPPNAE